jgi:hypothetical protein
MAFMEKAGDVGKTATHLSWCITMRIFFRPASKDASLRSHANAPHEALVASLGVFLNDYLP